MRHVMCLFVRLIWGSYVRWPARFKAFLRPLWIDAGHRRGERASDELYENSAMNFMKIRRRETHLPSFLLSSGRDAVGET